MPTSLDLEPLREARAVLAEDDLDFVLEGIEGLPPSRAFVVLDGLRDSFGWDQNVHLELVEHVTSSYDVRLLRN